MLTIVFYATNGQAAKQRARDIAAQEKGNYARCYDVSAWDGTLDKCDAVEVMSDVPRWQKNRITEVYGEFDEVIHDGEVVQEEEPIQMMSAKESDKKAVHRGGGRWFVVSSADEIISGPHDKAEAKRLSEEV